MANILLLIMIYISFISLGLPDTVLGVAWPSIRRSLNLPIEAAGIFVMMTTLGTAFSSFISGFVLKKLGTGKVVFISCVLTGSALLGYSLAPSFLWLLILTIPLGIGAGSVDTGLNNYVANHYSSRHMSWLHCFWGVGAFIGPNIMTLMIARLNNWKTGYQIIGIIQLSIALLLLFSLPLWKINNKKNITIDNPHHEKTTGLKLLFKKGVFLSIIAFPLYIGVEGGIGLWLGSYLFEGRGINQFNAGIIVSIFYASITIGRFINGIIAEKFSNKILIRIGIIILIFGVILFNIPINVLLIPSIILLGIGCAPIFPSMVHETPQLFGSANSQTITGYQIGMAYLSGIIITPVIGLIAGKISMNMIPVLIGFFAISIFIVTERINYLFKENEVNTKQAFESEIK